jgi:hypothetical protein
VINTALFAFPISSHVVCLKKISQVAAGLVSLTFHSPGHTFCRNCLVNINDNNPKGASCPLCRETFTLEQIHLVRVDPADPLPKFSYEQINHSDDTDSDLSDTRNRANNSRSSPWNQEPRIREEARQLELRVQQAASVKCTFEEVSALRDDIQNWLLTEPKYKPISKVSSVSSLFSFFSLFPLPFVSVQIRTPESAQRALSI